MKSVASLTALLALVSCDQPKPPAPPPPATVLMVTWLVPGQPPQTTQTQISDMTACAVAQRAAVEAGQAAQMERTRMNEADKATARQHLTEAQAGARAGGYILSGLNPEDQRLLAGVALPQVSAYCINK